MLFNNICQTKARNLENSLKVDKCEYCRSIVLYSRCRQSTPGGGVSVPPTGTKQCSTFVTRCTVSFREENYDLFTVLYNLVCQEPLRSGSKDGKERADKAIHLQIMKKSLHGSNRPFLVLVRLVFSVELHL